ncbi:MAG TPA: ABC transporter permease [Dehalococcoidia bacterium]|nr:ABC transporter permease [Dehalococcoidia bacterium]
MSQVAHGREAEDQWALGLAPDRPRLIRWMLALGRFMRDKKAGGFSLVIVVTMSVLAVFGDALAPYGRDETFRGENPHYDINSLKPEAMNPTILSRLNSPSWNHPLGTDDRGRDLLSRLMMGAQLAMTVGVVSALIATGIGSTMGIISGYFGGWFDLVVQRLVDAMIAIPGLLILLMLVQITEPSMRTTILALSFGGIWGASRVVRSAALVERGAVHVEAARTVGAGPVRIMARHVFPNILSPIVVIFTISIGGNILAESGLAFLNLGVPGPSWGQMVNLGRTHLDTKPIMSIMAGGAITVTVLAFNLLGDAIRDVTDPRQRGA